MQENNFEKDTRLNLGGLKIQPSAAVWNNLETMLHRKKRRRFIYIFSGLMVLLVTGLIGFFLYYNGQDGKQPLMAANPESKTPDQRNGARLNDGLGRKLNEGQAGDSPMLRADAQTGIAADAQTGNAADAQAGIADKAHPAIVPEAQPATGAETPGNSERRIGNTDKLPGIGGTPVTIHERNHNTGKVSGTGEASAPTNKKETANPDDASVSKTQSTRPDKLVELKNEQYSKNQPVTSNHNLNPLQLIDPVRKETSKDFNTKTAADFDPLKPGQVFTVSILEYNTSSIVTAFRDPVIMQQEIKAGKRYPGNGYELGLMAGISGLIMHLPDDIQMNSQPAPVYSSPVVGSGTGIGSSAILGPSTVKPGPAFRISYGLRKPLGKRSALTAAISYTYLSNSIRVGQYVNNTFTSQFGNFVTGNIRAYTGLQQQQFTNQFHVVSVPLRYGLLLNPSARIGVQWNIGVMPGYLVGENALVYWRSIGGSYHRDRSAYNRFRLDLSTGFDFMIGSGKLKWSIGPELSASANQLISKPEDRKQHFLYGGVTGKFYFGK